MPLVYATVDDLTAWLPPTLDVPDDAERRLLRASARLRRALLTAVYDVGPSGLPTDAEVSAAFRDATCAIVEYRLTNGDDDAGSGGTWTSVSAGSVAMSRAAADPVAAAAELPQSAIDVLAVLPTEVFRLGAVAAGGCRW
ncbi:hypothetical protein B4N89_20565 [Embleya scabrispora]|uniref:Uncharacterized protein n=1 Tax=Embleya scabrispora TaxID=159449 RepID=A0A1T3P1K9_9ACTN|nr:hypothetical protein [Embleya scabrispora]OPC83009.1 hypothetical protein B4N89_20565 [Embleya scabrispora]